MQKRVYIAYTGGTFGMLPSFSGFTPKAGLNNKLINVLPPTGHEGMPEWELHEYAQLIDSSMAQPQDWHTIALDIAKQYDAFDGFVIIHGTDTMAYTAAYLSFALQGLNKPVIVTGSQIPLVEPNSDAYSNLMGALIVAAHSSIAEVGLYFNGQLMRGNRSIKYSSQDFNAFSSPNYPLLATCETSLASLKVNTAVLLPKSPQQQFYLNPPTTNEVAIIRLHPGFSVAQLTYALQAPLKAVILQTFGSGNGPTQLAGFLEVLQAATARGLLIINLSQCVHGRVDQQRYAAGEAFNRVGVIGGYDLTTEAAITKLHYLWAQGLANEAIKQHFLQPLVGELTL